MARIDNLNEAQQIATALQSGRVVDPETRADLELALRAWYAGQQKTAPASAAPPPIRPPLDRKTAFNDPMPIIKAGSRELLAQAVSAGHGLAGVGLDAMEFTSLVGSAVGRGLEIPGMAEANERDRAQIHVLRKQLDEQALRGLETMTGYTGFPAAGDLLGQMLAFGGKFWQGKTWLGGVGKGTVAGAGASALGATEGAESIDDLLKPMTFGGIIGGAGTAALTARWGIPYWVSRKYAEAISGSQLGRDTLALEKEIQQLRKADGTLAAPNFSFTTAGIAADNPWLASLEIGAAQSAAIKHQVESLKLLSDGLTGMFKPGKASVETVQGLHNTVNKVADDMQALASTRYSAGLEALQSKYGDNIAVDLEGYRDAVKAYVGEFENQKAMFPSLEVPPLLAKHLEAIENLAWNEGGMTLAQAQTVTKTLNKLIGGKVGQYDQPAGPAADMARVLKAKFLLSMKGQTSDAANDLEVLNKAYATDEAIINEHNMSVLGLLFGSKEDLPKHLQNPDKALATLMQRLDTPAAATAARELLQKHAPSLLEDFKSRYIHQIVYKAQDPTTASSRSQIGRGTETDLDTLAWGLKGRGDDGTAGYVGRGLFTPEEQNHLVKTAQALQVIQNTYLKKQNIDASRRLGDMAINLTSMSKEFLARWAVWATTRGTTMERLLIDPSAREMMITLSKKSPDSRAFKMALAGLAYRVGAAQGGERSE